MDAAKDDLAEMAARLEAMDARLSYLVRQQEKTGELLSEMTPILREVMGVATTKLDAMDKKGYFAFGREFLRVGDQIVEGFQPDDVRKLGDAVVGIVETVRAMTQPRILEIAGEASKVLEKSDEAEPLGLLGMVRATRDDNVQKGMAVMMEMMRHVGRAARAVDEQRKADPSAEKKAKLAALLGPTKKKVLGIERPARVADAPRPLATCAPETKPRESETAAVIDGVAFGADGHLADPSQWSPALAQKLAAAQSVTLDEARWAVVTFARTDFETTSASPNIRRLTQGANLSTRELYALFPKAPARTIAKIAGIPKPVGCI